MLLVWSNLCPKKQKNLRCSRKQWQNVNADDNFHFWTKIGSNTKEHPSRDWTFSKYSKEKCRASKLHPYFPALKLTTENITLLALEV